MADDKRYMGFWIGHLHQAERNRIHSDGPNPQEREMLAKGEDPWAKFRGPLPPSIPAYVPPKDADSTAPPKTVISKLDTPQVDSENYLVLHTRADGRVELRRHPEPPSPEELALRKREELLKREEDLQRRRESERTQEGLRNWTKQMGFTPLDEVPAQKDKNSIPDPPADSGMHQISKPFHSGSIGSSAPSGPPQPPHSTKPVQDSTNKVVSDDRSARIQFILGLSLGLAPWGLSLIGITLNIWLGCFILAATFILIAHAFWIWEGARRWPMPLRLITIAFAFIFSAGFVGKQVITQYRQEHSEPAVVSLECNFTVLPISVSADSPLHLVELSPSLLNGVTDFVSANPTRWLSSDAFGMAYRCRFVNRGTLPASLETSFQMAFREALATSSPSVTEPGRVVASHEHHVEIPILAIPNGEYIFYLVNRSPLFVDVQLPQVTVIQGADRKDRRQIQLMESGSAPVLLTFPPIHEK